MSFTKSFQYDVFISYASADNVAPNDKLPGLVSAFHRDLRTELKRQAIGDELEIFFDNNSLQDHGLLTDQILQAAGSSAVMIVFHSPAYDASLHWCHREFFQFRTLQPEWEQRLFLIALDKDTLPTSSLVLRGTAANQRFRSFFEERAVGWFPFRTDEPQLCNPQGLTFSKEVTTIARQLAPLLRSIRRAAPAKAFLTCSSDTFLPERANIKNELIARGYEVYETGPWVDQHIREAEAERLIRDSDLVVGIEESFGTERELPPSQHSREQCRIAAGFGKNQLRWLPAIRHGFSDEEYAQRMEWKVAKSVGLQEFIGLVVAALEAAKHPPPVEPGPGGTDETSSRFVLLVCAEHDENGALAELSDAIDELDVPRDGHVDFPPLSDPEAIRAWWKRIKDSSGSDHVKLLFLDGACDRDWIDSHLRNYRALRSDLGKKLSVGLCECQPLPKAKEQKRRFRPTSLMPIFQHNDREALKNFIFQ